MRKWLKKIILECLESTLKEQPLIISQRAPSPDDVYEKGTTWKDGINVYVAKKVIVEWEKVQ